MRRDDDAVVARVFPVPRSDVPDLIDRHVFEPRVGEHLRHARATEPFLARRSRNRRQRSLTRERRFIRALNVNARGANAIVGEESVDHGAKV